MKFIPGKWETDLEAVCDLAFADAANGNMSADVTELFSSFIGSDVLWDKAHSSLGASLRKRYGNKCAWRGDLKLVPLPELGFDTIPVPHLAINVRVYIVWIGEVETRKGLQAVTAVGQLGKPETLTLPLVFILALLDHDLDRFRILGRSGSHTTWGIPGTKPVRLPDDFTYQLARVFERKSVSMWLADFGSQGRGIAPLVIGCLLGLISSKANPSLSAGREAWDKEKVINALEGMAYRRAEAEAMFLRAAPRLRAEHTLEDVIRIILQERGKEG